MPLDSPTPHLILGGARSGKSAHAEALLLELPPPYTYVATAQLLDAEMANRVAKHRARRSADWHTIESPLDLPQTLRALQGQQSPVLVDCLTLWLTNLLLSEVPEIDRQIAALCDTVLLLDYPLFLVSNEVGYGIVPDNALARRFRDLAGHTNQRLAGICPSVTLVVAGLPLRLN